MKSIWRAIAAVLLLTGCTNLTEAPSEKFSLPAREIPGTLIFDGPSGLTILRAGQRDDVPLPEGLRDYVISPDGRFLAGHLARGTLVTVAIVDLEHGDVRTLHPGGGLKVPAWSPDSRHLAVVRTSAGEKPGALEVYDRLGALETFIPLEAGEGRSVAWAPDSRRVAVTIGWGHLQGDANLWLVDTASGAASLQAEEAWAGTAKWHPDGDLLSYVVSDGSIGSKVMLRAPDGKVSTVVTAASLAPSHPMLAERFDDHVLQIYGSGWSPDGKDLYLVFKVTGNDPRFGLVRIGPDGTNAAAWVLPVFPELSPANIRPARPCIPHYPAFLQKGRRIVSVQQGPGCDGKLSILDPGTLQEELELTIEPGMTAHASPDGEWLAVSGEERTEVITLVNGVLMRVRLETGGRLLRWME